MAQLMTHPFEGQFQAVAIAIIATCIVVHLIYQWNKDDKE